MHDPSVILGRFEDHRAGLSIDARHERAARAAGNRQHQPLAVLWSKLDDLEELYGNPVLVWKDWADDVTGHAIESGHHMAELAPDELAATLIKFLL